MSFSFISISSRTISNNGVSLGFNSLYSNINGIERQHISLLLPKLGQNQPLFEEEPYEHENFAMNFEEAPKFFNNNAQSPKNLFLDMKKDIENENDYELDESILKKEKELQELKEEEKNINLDKTNLFDSFMESELDKIEKKVGSEKKEFDKKCNFDFPKLEINKSDKEKIHNYKNKIKKLNKYSNSPNYNKIMKNFNLDKYV